LAGAVELTPADERGQAPCQGVEPDQQDGHDGSALGVPVHGLQGPGDDQVAVQGDGQQVDHGRDAKQRPAERIQLTTW